MLVFCSRLKNHWSSIQSTKRFFLENASFLSELCVRYAARVDELLAERERKQQTIDNGQLPDFLSETKDIRLKSWKILGIPNDLQDRRVEITGPTADRKMVINAPNTNVKVFMADFEDSMSPVWDKVLDGQINLRDSEWHHQLYQSRQR